MNDTERLIDRLSQDSAPIKRLSSPLRRTALWLLLATLTVVSILGVLGHGPRPGWWQDMASPGVALECAVSVLTGVLAAYAAFQISVPGRSPSWAWLPLPAAALWLAGLCVDSLRDAFGRGVAAFALDIEGLRCAQDIALISLPIGFILLLMVRHAGVVRPAPTAMLTALSAAALSSAAVGVIHECSSAVAILAWHLSAVLLLSLLSWRLGARLFAWIGYARK
ncbi:NrsF family protein [Pseudomonas sp. CGJS7]|uniref:NrsF family protein n=1 Tax=Pseudomonas sp. CGJS7 TaxID=3109348 RepID=UPI00300B61CB